MKKRAEYTGLGWLRSSVVAIAQITLASGIALTLSPVTLHAQSVNGSQDNGEVERGGNKRINMGVGKSVIVNLPRDAAEIFVANPKVANAVVRSARTLYVIAVAGGQTTIFAMDKSGNQISRIEISVGRDIAELGRILQTAMPGSDIKLRTVNDTIILTGSVDSAGEAQKAMDIARGFIGGARGGAAGAGGAADAGGAQDNRVINSITIRGRDQVMLKVTIAEVQRQIVKQLGLENAQASGNWGTFTQNNPLEINGIISQTAANLTGRLGSTSLQSTIRAFERNGVARILAEPTVTAVSGETAKFLAGGEIPINGGVVCDPQTNRCTTTVNFKPVGVSLNFTPVVLSEGRILLRVATEVTEIDPTITINSIPAMRTRKHETSVELPSGASIASAGLIQTKGRQALTGTPGLMNLPILGSLFRSRDYQREETELMIIITPFISKPVNPSALSKPTDGLRDPTDPQTWLLGRMNKIYSPASNPQLIRNFRSQVGFIND